MSALGAAAAAEWVKVRSVRSTPIMLGAFAVVGVGLGWLVAGSFADSTREQDPLAAGFFSLLLGQLLLITFAVQFVGSEYSTGTIRVSLAAVPSRGRFYAAKMIVTGLVVAAVAVVVELATFFTAQSRLGDDAVPIGEWETIEALLGGWIHLTLLSLFAAGLAVMIRSMVVALSVLLPILFLSSQGLGNIDAIRPWAQYLPDQVGMVVMHLTVPGDPQFGRDYGAWEGIGLLVLWTAAALVGGWIALRRRDA
ncbi:ABC transporter permease [Glycomyces albidus]|uniref:ABC transporter permease subunit n=1 Tax=Glycomyces albidus TaxID=2656774 RepID=A0A6L5GG65_9ACTN|nr:ABC transporter permease [Glycomyces albidus]MQM28555.1 ABC transporter permease subunit [Glycomyces albidus]